MTAPSKHSTVRAGGSVLLELDEQFNRGGEAWVFGVIDEPHLAVKLLRSPGRSETRLDAHLRVSARDWLADNGKPRLDGRSCAPKPASSSSTGWATRAM